MSEGLTGVVFRCIQDLIKPPLFLTVRQEIEGKREMEVRYLNISDSMRSSLLFETAKLFQKRVNETVREQLNDELTAVVEYTLNHSVIFLTIYMMNEGPIRLTVIQSGRENFEAMVHTQADIRLFIQELGKRFETINGLLIE